MHIIKNIDFKIDKFSLKIEEIVLPEEGLIFISGESGSGKSTFLEILVGFIDCPGMSWLLKNFQMQSLSIEDRKIGYVMQGGQLFPHLSVYKCMSLAALSRNQKISPDIAMSYLNEVNLAEENLNKKIRVLSGGERQRVALLCAMIGKPNVLLLDEVFSALDKENVKLCLKYIRKHCLEHSIPALIVSHEIFKLKDKELQLDFREGELFINSLQKN